MKMYQEVKKFWGLLCTIGLIRGLALVGTFFWVNWLLTGLHQDIREFLNPGSSRLNN